MTQDTRTVIPQTVAPMRRSWRILLIASLALNLLVLGIVAGALIGGPSGFGKSRGIDLELGPLVRALSREDRQAIREELRGNETVRQSPRRERDAMLAELLVTLRADDFDPAAAAAVLRRQYDRTAALMGAGQGVLLERIAAMSPQDRLAFADRLEAEMGHGRGDDQGGDDQGGDDDR